MLTQPLTRVFRHSFLYSITHSYSQSHTITNINILTPHTHSLTHTLIHSHTHSFTHTLTNSHNNLLTLTYSHTYYSHTHSHKFTNTHTDVHDIKKSTEGVR